ncbi:response regulator [bacterium]|nr:response regulator [bacterium]
MATLLIIDDEKNICSLYKKELEDEGYSVFTAQSAKDGFEILNHNKIDLVVLDIRMPEMDGITALQKMLSNNRNLPVIINTAYNMYKDNFLTWLAEDYIIKSSDLTELKEKIRKILARGKA